MRNESKQIQYKMKEKSPDFDLEDAFVAPWGLANEERPIHYIWEGNIESIEIKFVEPVEIVEIFNIEGDLESYLSIESNNDVEFKILKIPAEELVAPGYLSAKFVVPELLEQPIVGQVVETKFEGEEWSECNKELTFTVRPMIRIVDIPEKIQLLDESVEIIHDEEDEEKEEMEYPGVIEAQMEQIGFGMAQVEAEAWGEGELLSQEESVFQDIAETLKQAGFADENPTFNEVPETAREESTVEIPDHTVKNVVDDFRDWLSNESFIESLTADEIDAMLKLVEANDTEFDMSDIYKHFEYLLMNSILDVVDRHPSDNVQMQSPQTKIEIESRIKSFNIIFKLSDNVGNDYESEAIEIDIEDKRSTGGIAELELETDWEEVQLDPSELNKLKETIETDL